MGQITATRNLVATKVVRLAGQWVPTTPSMYVSAPSCPLTNGDMGVSAPIPSNCIMRLQWTRQILLWLTSVIIGKSPPTIWGECPTPPPLIQLTRCNLQLYPCQALKRLEDQKMSKSLIGQLCTNLMTCDTHNRTCPRYLPKEYSSQVSKRFQKDFSTYHVDRLGHTDRRRDGRAEGWTDGRT